MSFPLFFWFDRNFASFPLIQHFPFACCHHSMLKHAYSFKSYYLTLLALSLPLTFTLKPVVYYDFFGLWSRSLMAMTLERFFFRVASIGNQILRWCLDIIADETWRSLAPVGCWAKRGSAVNQVLQQRYAKCYLYILYVLIVLINMLARLM